MSIIHAPVIVTRDLCFYYDARNTKKSWKGAPATNYITGLGWAGDGTNQTGFVKGVSQVTDPTLLYEGLPTYLVAPGSSFNMYLTGADVSASTSTDWTFSCRVRRQDRQAISSLNVYMYFPSSDGASAGTITDVGKGWYQIHRTRTGTSAAITLAGFTGFAANVKYLLSGPTLTKTTYPVYPIEANGTRSTTQSLLDLTGLNSATVGSLTYADDNSFSFNALGNYLALPSSLGYATAVSAFAWVKTLGAPRGGYHIVLGPAALEISIPTAGNLRTGVETANGRFVSNDGTGLADGNWHYIGFTYDGATKTSYIDGVQAGTFAVTGLLTSASATRSVGVFGVGDNIYGMNGKIDITQVYARALTSTEVKQNFCALRSRYGV